VEEQKKKGGQPGICNVYAYFYFMFEEDDDKLIERENLCKSGSLLCGECKNQLAERVKTFLIKFQEKREKAKDVLEDFLLK
jgi:tryptophanyl-tRNA synthetase